MWETMLMYRTRKDGSGLALLEAIKGARAIRWLLPASYANMEGLPELLNRHPGQADKGAGNGFHGSYE